MFLFYIQRVVLRKTLIYFYNHVTCQMIEFISFPQITIEIEITQLVRNDFPLKKAIFEVDGMIT